MPGDAPGCFFRLPSEGPRIDADGESVDDNRPPFEPDRLARLTRDIEEVPEAILEIVEMLARLEADWVASDFTLDEAALRDRLAALAGGAD